MRKLAIVVALASTVLATPAVARDHAPYVGIEGGVMWNEGSRFAITDNVLNPVVYVRHKSGYDVDAIAGYDLGHLRAEAEVAYKRNHIRGTTLAGAGQPAAGHSSNLSVMGNLLLDYGDENSFSGYLG